MPDAVQPPRVIVRRGADAYTTALEALRALALPDMRGKRVLLKPNAGRRVPPGLGITTNPAVVAAACDFFLACGAHPSVGDSTILGVTPPECLEATGIAAAARARTVPVLDLDELPARKAPIPHGVVLDHLMLCGALPEFDFIVSIPVMKTHMHCRVSLGLKNMKGCLRGREKVRLHQLPPCPAFPGVKPLDLAIADMATILTPQLVLIDGSTGMQGLGPSAGSQIHPGLIVASEHVLAADAVAATLMGFAPHDIAHLRLAAQRLPSTLDCAQMDIDPPHWRAWITPFEPPPRAISFEYQHVRVLDKESCSACLSTMLMFLKRHYAELGGYLPLTFAIGKGHAELPDRSFCVGNCTAKAAAGQHVFIKGCPPVASDIVRHVLNQQKLSNAHDKKR